MLLKKNFAFVFFVCVGMCSFGQVTFQRTYGGINGDWAYSVQQTNDGGYIISGDSYSFGVVGYQNIYLIKTSALGDTLWTKTHGGTNHYEGFYIQQTIDGGYIIAERTPGAPINLMKVYLIKTSAMGDTLWARTYGGIANDGAHSVQETNDSGFIVTGYTFSFGAGNSNDDAYLIKTDFNGNILWSKTYGGTISDEGFSVQQTNDGGYIIAGSTNSFGAGSFDVFLIKTDINGNTLWTKTYGGMGDDIGRSVEQTSDGGYIVAGHTFSFGIGDRDIYLIKTDSTGNALWTKTYGGMGIDEQWSVHQTNDGGYIVGGATVSFGAGGSDVYLIKTNTVGDTLWTKTYGGSFNDWGHSIQQTADRGYIIGGGTDNFGAGSTDVYLIKTDSLGNSGCNEGSTTTIVTSPTTIVTSPATIVSSPSTISTIPTTFVSSGGILSTPCIATSIQSELANSKSEISISPNPSSGSFTISSSTNFVNAAIEIYNVFGDNICTDKINNASQKEINLKNIADGIYFVQVINDGKTQSKKFIKN